MPPPGRSAGAGHARRLTGPGPRGQSKMTPDPLLGRTRPGAFDDLLGLRSSDITIRKFVIWPSGGFGNLGGNLKISY